MQKKNVYLMCLSIYCFLLDMYSFEWKGACVNYWHKSGYGAPYKSKSIIFLVVFTKLRREREESSDWQD